ncbi:MAG TPA: glutamyl-tRNA reductase [Natronosporangium sp.]|nr:glutamyl-tRNA reductase [Natronosporangium sp.]
MNLLVVGANHRTADVSLLERLSVTADGLRGILDDLLRREHITEAVALSTCNRVEVYAGVSAFHGGVADVSGLLAERAGVDPAALAPHLYVHWEAEAVQHALRVAAGLDSMVVGEAQILGQLREAYATAAEAGATGRLLHEVMQQALRVGKRAHAETGIDAAGRTVVSAALTAAVRSSTSGEAVDPSAPLPDRLPDEALAGWRGLVIGAGAMGALALATMARAGAGPLYVASRRTDRAARLAASYGAEAVDMADLARVIAGCDLVVSATASPRHVLPAATVEAALAGRAEPARPLVICDLAVPRDVEPAAAALPGVVLIDIERLAAAGPAAASAEVSAVEAIVAEEAEEILASLRDAQVAPTVAALRARAAEVVEAELARLAQRRPDLTDEQRAEVAHAVHRLVQRLLHQPTVRVRKLAAEPGGEAYAEVLAELFDLQVPQPRRADEIPPLTNGAAPGAQTSKGAPPGVPAGREDDRK